MRVNVRGGGVGCYPLECCASGSRVKCDARDSITTKKLSKVRLCTQAVDSRFHAMFRDYIV